MSNEADKSFSTANQHIEGVGYNLHETSTSGNINPKVFFGNKIDARLHKTLKVYAANSNYEISYILEQALSEYFVNHRQDFPPANLTIAIEQEPRLRKAEKIKQIKCMFAHCENPAEPNHKATRLYDNKTFDVCIEHYNICKSTPDRFEVH
jgi:hypothetical protein